ncbi:hypothetical protein ABC347_08130 [Sphingomonas sp. 1P06PA]|uniref:hypothetical protein n=1 Tax=Sphingomonas sp. 1P06PA TaxID=554121 RepID=UPI0039A66E9C
MNCKMLLLAGFASLAAAPLMAQETAPSPTAPPAATTPGATTPSPAAGATAGTTAKVTAGASVSDAQGGAVGTVESIDGEFAVLSTGTNKVRLPVTSFAQGTTGLVIGMTKAEVDAAASGAAASTAADAKAQVTAGASVSDAKGGAVGKIESVDGEFATVATANSKVKLPLTAFAKGTTGPVIAMTAAELDAAAKSAAPTGTN